MSLPAIVRFNLSPLYGLLTSVIVMACMTSYTHCNSAQSSNRVAIRNNVFALVSGFSIMNQLSMAWESNPRMQLGRLPFYH